jgi:hypothetical protein
VGRICLKNVQKPKWFGVAGAKHEKRALRAANLHVYANTSMMQKRAFLFCLILSGFGALGCEGQTLSAGTTYLSEMTEETVVRLASLPKTIDAVAMDSENLYMTCEDGWVYRLSKTGTGGPARVVSFPGNYAWGLAVDQSNVYVTAIANGLDGGVVLSAPKGGGEGTVLASTQVRPWGIAVDDSEIYWLEQGAPSGENAAGSLQPGAVVAMPKTPGAGVPAKALASDVISGDFLALDDDAIYWHELDAIRRVPKTGGAAETLFHAPIATLSTNLIVSGGLVFWEDSVVGSASIMSVATGGGRPNTLAANVSPPSSLALLGETLFWTDMEGTTVGTLRSLPVSGGTETVISPANAPTGSTSYVASFVLVAATASFLFGYESKPAFAATVDRIGRTK